MDDQKIIHLYFARDQEAVQRTEDKYRKSLYRLSYGILRSYEDAEENANDTLMAAWQNIPPIKPESLYAYLSCICRTLALKRLEKNHAKKRSAEIIALTQEMESCIPANRMTAEIDEEDLGGCLDRFLSGLDQEKRLLFLHRYWRMESIAEISAGFGWSESRVKSALYRIRKELKTFLKDKDFLL